MKSIITSGKDAFWQAENGEMIQVNLSGSGDKKRDMLIKILWDGANRLGEVNELLKSDIEQLKDFQDRMRQHIDNWTDKENRSKFIDQIDYEVGRINTRIPSLEHDIQKLQEQQEQIRKYVSGLSMEPVGRE